MKRDFGGKNLYPQLTSMDDDDFEEKYPEEELVQSIIPENQSEEAYQPPTKANNRNGSQFKTNRNKGTLSRQASNSDDIDEEYTLAYRTEDKSVRNRQNASKKTRHDKSVNLSSQIDQNLHKVNPDSDVSGSAKAKHHKKKSHGSSKPPITEVGKRQQLNWTAQKFFSIDFWWITLPVLFFLFFGYIYIFKDVFPTNAYQENSLFNASDVIHKLQTEFREQPRISYRIIYSALKKVSERNSKAPAIIVLLAANGSETVCNNFAHRLSNLLNTPDNSVKIQGVKYESSNTDEAKMEIDKLLKDLKVDQHSSILVENLDHIPGEVALIFHTYWDHENAPYKQAVFVMTVTLGKAIDKNANSKHWDKAVEDHLYSVWTDIGVDQTSALLSRLTVSVAAIVG